MSHHQAPPEVSRPFDWIEFHADEGHRHPDLLGRILKRAADGATVTGAFTPDEAARAVKHLATVTTDLTPAMFGPMLGLPLAHLPAVVEDPSDRTGYLDDAERARVHLVEAFGFDPADRIAEVIEPFAGGLQVVVPSEGGRRYAGGNVRWFEPGGGGLPAHAGNEFLMHGDGSFAHLQATTRTVDHLSWFVVLQPPEVGGALSVFDLIHGVYTPRQEQWTDSGRDDDDFESHVVRRIAPGAGDLVIFGGGWRYHRVDEVGGGRARVTYGGFAGPGRDGRTLSIWF